VLVIQIVLATVLALFGVGLGVLVVDASRIVRRIRRDKTHMVSALAFGPTEVEGKLRATDPVIALDGSRAVAADRTFYYKFKKDEDVHTSVPVTHTECSSIEVSDGSGTCVIEVDHLVLLGHPKHYVFKAEDFRERYPKIWSEVVHPEAGETVEEVIASELAVPDGARGFVSGEATLDDSPERGKTYRDGKRRFKLRGGPQRPVIVSSWPEEVVIGMLQRPLLRAAWISLLCVLVAALAIAIPIVLTARAGL
jgi:hypothetical protein